MKELLTKFKPLKWLDALPWPNLLIIALLAGIAPVVPEPHLLEKLRMLFQGTLGKPIDIFDLLMHASPLILAALKGFRQYKNRSKQK